MNKEKLTELLAAKNAAYASYVAANVAYEAAYIDDSNAYDVYLDAESTYNIAIEKSKLSLKPNK